MSKPKSFQELVEKCREGRKSNQTEAERLSQIFSFSSEDALIEAVFAGRDSTDGLEVMFARAARYYAVLREGATEEKLKEQHRAKEITYGHLMEIARPEQ